MGSRGEEVWYSRFQIARLQHQLGYAWPLVLDAYLNAYLSCAFGLSVCRSALSGLNFAGRSLA
jgi:hypothetical protein